MQRRRRLRTGPKSTAQQPRAFDRNGGDGELPAIAEVVLLYYFEPIGRSGSTRRLGFAVARLTRARPAAPRQLQYGREHAEQKNNGAQPMSARGLSALPRAARGVAARCRRTPQPIPHQYSRYSNHGVPTPAPHPVALRHYKNADGTIQIAHLFSPWPRLWWWRPSWAVRPSKSCLLHGALPEQYRSSFYSVRLRGTLGRTRLKSFGGAVTPHHERARV